MNPFDDLHFGRPKPPLKKSRKKARGIPTVVVGDCDLPEEVVSITKEITQVWGHGAKQLNLDFLVMNEMAPNQALLIYDLLRRKPPGTMIISRAHSPIIGPGVLVWLAADRRYIRSTAWFFLRPPHPEGRRRVRPHWIDEGDWWRSTEADAIPNFNEMDYRVILRHINNYLPITGLAGKILTPALLDEYCLLDPELMKPPVIGSRPTTPQIQPDENSAPDAASTANCDEGNGQKREKRVWFIERNANGRFTLKGGYPPSMMKENPVLREKDIGLDVATKEDLLRHLDEIEFCLEGDKVVMDGDQIVMG